MKNEREQCSKPEDSCDRSRLCVLKNGHSGDCYNLTRADVIASVLHHYLQIGGDGLLRANSKDVSFASLADAVAVALAEDEDYQCQMMQAEMHDFLVEEARRGDREALSLLPPWDRYSLERELAGGKANS
jgi:hypothetical protein